MTPGPGVLNRRRGPDSLPGGMDELVDMSVMGAGEGCGGRGNAWAQSGQRKLRRDGGGVETHQPEVEVPTRGVPSERSRQHLGEKLHYL